MPKITERGQLIIGTLTEQGRFNSSGLVENDQYLFDFPNYLLGALNLTGASAEVVSGLNIRFASLSMTGSASLSVAGDIVYPPTLTATLVGSYIQLNWSE